MPGLDRIGPRGLGPMTGRGMGMCGYGRGWRPGAGYMGCAWGYGRGWRHWYYATGLPRWARPYGGIWRAPFDYPPAYPSWSVEDELNELKGYASGLEEELNNIRTQIAELEKEQVASGESQ